MTTLGRLIAGTEIDAQIRRDQLAIDMGVERYRRIVAAAVKRHEGSHVKSAERVLAYWLEAVVEGIKADVDALTADKSSWDMTGWTVWGPAYQSLDARKMGVIAIAETLSTMMRSPQGFACERLGFSIGRAIVAEINATRLKEKDLWQDLCWNFKNLHPQRINWYANRSLDKDENYYRVATHLGHRLLWTITERCMVPTDDGSVHLAFHRSTLKRGYKKLRWIEMDDAVYDAIDDGHNVRQLLRPVYMAMIVPPCSWVQDDEGRIIEGGYYKIRTPYMSKPSAVHKAAMRSVRMDKPVAALNAAGRMAWKCNVTILEVVEHYWAQGGGVPGIPSRHDTEPPERLEGEDRETWWKRCRRIKFDNRSLRCQRYEFARKLDRAQDYAEHEKVYFPHQYDFRGRMYAIPTNLNHQGDDLCRGLLEAGVAGPVDEAELAIEVANTWGQDKVSNADRIAWVSSNFEMVKSVADDPIGDTSWFKADKPWQFLAACMAFTGRTDKRYAIVRRDGTCNGLQHYAALGRDAMVAPHVNVVWTAAPGSVYTRVAEATQELLRMSGTDLDMLLLKEADRKMCKPGTMTHYYNVTSVKAAQQVRSELIARGWNSKDLSIYVQSKYLSKMIREAIAKVCPRADAIMDWLCDCARRIARAGKVYSLISPTNFPMVQKYRDTKSIEISTVLQTVVLRAESDDLPPKVTKQVNGAAPNTIHMLDASHLCNTLLRMDDANRWMAAVHDSYWTHSGSCKDMQRTIREEFVAMYSGDLLSDIHRQLSLIVPGLPDPPSRGDLDINEVMNATYFFH